MVTQKEVAQREEALVSFLRMGLDTNATAVPKRTSNLHKDTLYLDVVSRLDGSKGLVIPLVYHSQNAQDKIEKLTKAAVHDGFGKPCWVFYKDGEDFFRFSGTDNRRGFRKKYGRSLREETIESRSKTMLLSIEERVLTTRKINGVEKVGYGNLLYYRPKSDVRKEGLSSYHFAGPVTFVKDPESRYAEYTPRTRDSTRRFKWDASYDVEAPFVFEQGTISSIEDPNVEHLDLKLK